jgi:glycosyltransferase involved in cell wall biosynthesis
MRQAVKLADAVVSTVPPSRVSWIREHRQNAKIRLIPVGSNIPASPRSRDLNANMPTVAVFEVTERNHDEARLLADVARLASEEIGPLRLLVFGRGAEEARRVLADALQGSQVHLEVHGVVPQEEIGALFAQADVQLFVRGGISTRRTSAIAGLASNLPLVGYWGEETDFPITEAGVRLVSPSNPDGLASELGRVLGDISLRHSLAERSRTAVRRYFSWDVIAKQFLNILYAPSQCERRSV